MLDHTATAWLRRLLAWLELFEDGFSHPARRGALRRYVQGLLSDVDSGGQPVLEPDALDLEITGQKLHFLLQRNLLRS